MRQAAQDERRQITVAARTGRTVDFLGDADVAGVVEHAIEADDRLGARQRRTGGGMAAAAEGDMPASVVEPRWKDGAEGKQGDVRGAERVRRILKTTNTEQEGKRQTRI